MTKRKDRKKKVPTRERVYTYYATYNGGHRHMKMTGIPNEVIPGKEYEVSEKLWQALASSKNWSVRSAYVYK